MSDSAIELFSEDDLLPLSALQHILFCPRQCALIHVEQLWEENLYTAQGRIMHDRVDQTGKESRRNIRIEYALPLRSLRLGLIGKADVVEFHRQPGAAWRPFPVEYKRGRAKKENWDKVQLCAQAICLEEMLRTDVPEGALFYGKTKRRQVVCFDANLRAKTMEAAVMLHKLVRSGQTPLARYEGKCDKCSFINLCLAKVVGQRQKVNRYISRMLRDGEE